MLVGLSCSDGPTAPATLEAPTNVTVVLATPTSALVTWVASANADQVRSYNVFRNGTKVGEVSTTSFTDSGLVELTPYKYDVSANGVSGIVSALSSDSPSSAVTPPDVTAPYVTASIPTQGSTGVSTASTITATFSEAVDSATVNSSTFVAKMAGAVSIAGTVSYTKATHVAEFRPTAGLPSGGGVTVA
ncbi:MAG: Ig-like domain-containing protein, partial [Thermoanaerobaculia bacterium]